ncbi:sensor histidine kinase [Prosthecobacter sp.]|uniref:sensor histidine kinase n=1 Tax=Prosthecobacter sp. TaxID=1965333 RepID=UPI0037839EF2
MKFYASFFAFAMLAQSSDSQWAERLAFWLHADLRRTEQRIAVIDDTLRTLPEFTQINSGGTAGFKTAYTPEEEQLWVEVTLPQTEEADTIVLVPPLAKGPSGMISGYGFPTRFRLETFDEQGTCHLVLDATAQDYPNTGGYPVLAKFSPQPVKRVRFTATQPWHRDGSHVLALSELMVLSGDRNVAAGAAVTASSTHEYPGSWSRLNLVDMITPLGLPVAPSAGGRLGFHSAVARQADEVKWVTLTFPEIVPLDEVCLVPVRRREAPLWFEYGFPMRCKIEAATQPDFSDAKLLHEILPRRPPVYGMNLVSFHAGHTPARYLRITATQLWERNEDFVFAIAEVQAFAKGENVALKASVQASDVLDDAAWSPAALTDGLTESGRLISVPAWLAQLDQRRLLEQERAGLIAARSRWIAGAQRTLVYGSVACVIAISLLACMIVWRQHRHRLRDARRLQEKLARDLHDEIGSNLGSIRLICSFARKSGMTLETLREDLGDIERVAAESADSMRDMVRLMIPQKHGGEQDWLEVLRGLAERLLRGHTLDCTLSATQEPDLETRRELYLLCKEALHNIARHARAQNVRFHLGEAADGLRIEISDDGIGFDSAQKSGGHGLNNLRERARAMHATLDIASSPGGGTRIRLDLPRTHRWPAR